MSKASLRHQQVAERRALRERHAAAARDLQAALAAARQEMDALLAEHATAWERREDTLGRIPVEPVREAVLAYMRETDVGWSTLALRLGWVRSGNKGDGARLKRRLGLMPGIANYTAASGECRTYRCYVTTISKDAARQVADAIHADPHQIGL